MLLTIFLLALIFIYLCLYWRRRKMPFQLKLIVHLILYIFTILVVVLVRNSVFHLIVRRGNFLYMYDDECLWGRGG